MSFSLIDHYYSNSSVLASGAWDYILKIREVSSRNIFVIGPQNTIQYAYAYFIFEYCSTFTGSLVPHDPTSALSTNNDPKHLYAPTCISPGVIFTKKHHEVRYQILGNCQQIKNAKVVHYCTVHHHYRCNLL